MAVTGERIDNVMVALGVESPALGDFLGTDRQTVGRWRRGERQPEGRFAAWLPLLLASTPWDLFGRPPGLVAAPSTPDPVPDGTTLASFALRPPGVILALQTRAGRAGEESDVAALAERISAMVSRAVARAITKTLAADEATNTTAGRVALAKALRDFAYALQDNAGIVATDILKAADALQEGRLT